MFNLWSHRSLSVRDVAVLGDSKKSNNILANREQGPNGGSSLHLIAEEQYVDAKEVCREVSALAPHPIGAPQAAYMRNALTCAALHLPPRGALTPSALRPSEIALPATTNEQVINSSALDFKAQA
jgi:hypothetical protein